MCGVVMLLKQPKIGTKNQIWRIILLLPVVVMICFASPGAQTTNAKDTEPDPPAGYRLQDEGIGVQLFQKDYQGGKPDYVQVIDLRQGAGLKLLHGPITAAREGRGQFGGADARIAYQSIKQYWSQADSSNDKVFCVINGQFFYMPESPTRLALPLKVDNEQVTDGFGYKQYEPEDVLMLELWDDRARIRQLSGLALNASKAPDILGGLSENANKKIKNAVGRTFVGLDDRDGDRTYETILVFNTSSATQKAAAEALRSFGADKVMMLDGGGSTHLLCKNEWYIPSERLIPQAIVIVAGNGPPYQASAEHFPDWPVIIADSENKFQIEMSNQGSESWNPETENLLVDKSPWGTDDRVSLPTEVAPGKKVILEWDASKFYRGGIYHIQANITHNEREFPTQGADFNLVVLPTELADRQEELQALVDEWRAVPETDVDTLVRIWLKEEGGIKLPTQSGVIITPNIKLSISDAMLIPVIMLPFVLVLVVVIRKTNR